MKKRNTKQVILPLITSFIWGSSFVAQSLGAGKVGGFTFTAARAIPAVLVLGALVLILRRVRHEEKYTPQQKKDLLEGGLVCGIFLTLGTNLQQFGIADTTAGKAGFITALYIVLVPLAGMFLGKKANKRLFLCVLIAVVGLYFLCFTGSEGAMSFGRGDFLVFLCAFAFTGHILCVDHYVQKVDGIALSCVQFAVMMVLSTVCAFTFETVDFAALGECMFYILYIGILSSAGGYTLQILAQKDGDPTVVSLLLSLESFFAVVCGAIILHERMSGREYLGCALMLTAGSRRKNKIEKAEKTAWDTMACLKPFLHGMSGAKDQSFALLRTKWRIRPITSPSSAGRTQNSPSFASGSVSRSIARTPSSRQAASSGAGSAAAKS